MRRSAAVIRSELPGPALACWASVFFSLSVLTYLISIAASQSFLTLAALLYFAHLLHANPKPRISFPPVKLPLALFCVWTVVSVIFAEFPDAGGFVIRKLALFLILLLTVNLVLSARHVAFLLKALLAEAAAVGLVGAGEFVRQYREVRAVHPHRVYLYMTVTRITGLQGHWMNFGGQQMLVFSAGLAFLLVGSGGARSGARPRRWWWFALVVLLASILLNLTRGVWLGCFGAAIYLVARWRARWLWILPVAVAITLVAGPRMLRRRESSVLHPRRDPSLAVRFEMWGVGARMIRRHPWVGVGPDNIPALYDFYMPPGKVPIVGYHDHLHDNAVQLAAERGIPCLAAWVWLMLAFLVYTIRIRRKLGSLRWVADAGIAAWLALVIEGVFEFNFGSSPVLMLFLFIMAAPFATEAAVQNETSRAAPPLRRTGSSTK
ncbi:MAG: O-antigen ligase family protein [Terriglobia bacterium]